MALFSIRFIAVVVLIAAMSLPAAAARKVALVVGIDAYENVPPLQKAVNDARAIGATLDRLGFSVILAEDTSRRELNRAILDFSSALEPGDTALFFFAGHGVHIDGRNFLLPGDIPQGRPGEEGFVAAEAIAADNVLDSIRARGVKISLLILDACRDNPFAREGSRSLGGTRGLARMAAPEGSFIMYSAGVGQTALDRLGDGDRDPNSVFTRSLIPLLSKPGLPITQIARRVRQDVQELAGTISHDQRPAYYDDITADFMFVARAPEANTTPAATSAPAPATDAGRSTDDKAIELAFWNSIRDSDNPLAFQSYLDKYPLGDFAALARLRIGELEQAAVPAEPVPAPTPKPDRSPDQDLEVELAYWNSISTSEDPSILQSYLDRYPGGRFASIARLRIEELSRPAPVAPALPEPAPAPPPLAAKPSFDCGKAQLAAEFAICRLPGIAALDRQLAQLYRKLRDRANAKNRNRLRDFQRTWLANRNACGANQKCLRGSYLRQLQILRRFTG